MESIVEQENKGTHVQTSLEASLVVAGIGPRLSSSLPSILGSYIIFKSYFQFVISSY